MNFGLKDLLGLRVPGTVMLSVFVAAASACGSDFGPDSGGPSAEGLPTFAVVRTDYSTTAIAGLEADGTIWNSAILDSGSVAPGLSTALSGDVVLAEVRPFEGILTVVDRFMTDVLTRYDLRADRVLGQVRTQGSEAFPSNPYDAARGEAGTVWVSRFGVNLDPEAGPLDRGNDLVEIDLSEFELTGRRVDLSRFDVEVDGSGEGKVAHARPGAVVRRGNVLAVGLAGLSFEFDAAGPGRLAVVDLQTLDVRGLELPEGLQNCGGVRAIPGTPDLVAVACTGFARPFGDPPQVRASSGVVVVRVEDDARGRVVRTWRPADDPARPLAVHSVRPLSPTRFVGNAFGALGDRPDELHSVDMESGDTRSVWRADEAFAIGLSAYDPTSGLLLVPDASRGSGGIHRFGVEAEEISFRGTTTFSDGPLPPRSVVLLEARP
jgi:hypothetical protein